jgi:hypothetical protein
MTLLYRLRSPIVLAERYYRISYVCSTMYYRIPQCTMYRIVVTNLKRRDTASYKEARRRDAPKGVSKKVSLLRTNR